MRVTNEQRNAIYAQVNYLLRDSYEEHNRNVGNMEAAQYEKALDKAGDILRQFKRFSEEVGRTSYIVPYLNQFLKRKYPEEFQPAATPKNLNLVLEAVNREITIFAPECKSAEELMSKILTKYAL